MPFPKIKLSDDSGNAVSVTSNRLDVNAHLAASTDIDIGNVVLTNTAGVDLYTSLATTFTIPDIDDALLLGTHALLSARVDSSTTIGLTAHDGTHNALHVALSDGSNILSISQHSENVVDYGVSIMGEAKTIDGSALPNIVSEGEAIRISASRHGIMYSHLTVFDGTKSAIVEDDSAQNSSPAMVNVGGEFRSVDTTYTAGDATILQANANGHLKIAGSHVDDSAFVLGTESGVMMMGFAGTQSVDADDAAALACTVAGQLEVTSTGTTINSYPQFDVDTSAFALSSASGINSAVTTAKEIIIQCGFTNTGYIVVGDSALVAAEGVDSMDGIRLEAGDTLTLAATTTANIYVRGSANDQLVNVMIIT